MTSTSSDNGLNSATGRAKSALTAFFDNRSDADRAIVRLRSAGLGDVRLMAGYEADGEASSSNDAGSFWSKLGDWLFPDDDRNLYAEGLRRGGFLVSVSVDGTTYEAAHDILDDDGAVDIDERADLWRTGGWSAAHDQKPSGSQGDIYQADAVAGAATGIGRFSRSGEASSARVRAYDLTEQLPEDVVDDVLPTGHQRTTADRHLDPLDQSMSPNEELDALRQKQSFPGGR